MCWCQVSVSPNHWPSPPWKETLNHHNLTRAKPITGGQDGSVSGVCGLLLVSLARSVSLPPLCPQDTSAIDNTMQTGLWPCDPALALMSSARLKLLVTFELVNHWTLWPVCVCLYTVINIDHNIQTFKYACAIKTTLSPLQVKASSCHQPPTHQTYQSFGWIMSFKTSE